MLSGTTDPMKCHSSHICGESFVPFKDLMFPCYTMCVGKE